jgi:sortase (surface protein transpeptidase)
VLDYDGPAMAALLIALRTRLLPAIVTSLGVVLVTAGLLSYTDPATAGTLVDAIPTVETLAPSNQPSSSLELPSASASSAPSGDPTPALDQSASPAPTAAGSRAVATRVVIPALKIDLPVVRGPDGYPLCNVAMYLKDFAQPGEGSATYIFAHARDGMFGPIYNLAIQKHNPRKMLGMIVQVYTSDDKLYLYEITEVRLHQLNLDAPTAATSEQLWLQTSEGPKGTPGKTQLKALPLSVGDADPRDAHPKTKPIACG